MRQWHSERRGEDRYQRRKFYGVEKHFVYCLFLPLSRGRHVSKSLLPRLKFDFDLGWEAVVLRSGCRSGVRNTDIRRTFHEPLRDFRKLISGESFLPCSLQCCHFIVIARWEGAKRGEARFAKGGGTFTTDDKVPSRNVPSTTCAAILVFYLLAAHQKPS